MPEILNANIFTLSAGDTWFLGIALGALAVLVIISEWIRTHYGWTGEITRKIVHIGTGLLIFLAALRLESGYPLVAIGVFFTAFNFIAVRRDWFRGMHDTERHTYGTVYYPAAVTVLILFFWEHYKPALAAGVLVMAVGDALAALVGKKARQPHLFYLSADRKSAEGSAAMFLSSWLVIGLIYVMMIPEALRADRALSLGIITLTAFFTTVVEAASSRGFDNITVPFAAAWMVHFQMTQPADALIQLLHGALLSAIVGYLTYRLKFLTLSGAVGAFMLGTVIFGIGGWVWSIPILTFFISASVISKAGRRRKEQLDDLFEKSSTRDFGQVLANGAVPGVIMLIYYFIQDERLYLVYCGVLAAVAADTWATETGTWLGGTVRHILTFQKVETGSSGGVTVFGTLGGAIGAALIAMAGFLSNATFFAAHGAVPIIALVVTAGCIGCLLDSVLGATLQSQYRCPVCGKVTEKIIHCGAESHLIRGYRMMHNDSVNLLCGMVGGMIILFVSF